MRSRIWIAEPSPYPVTDDWSSVNDRASNQLTGQNLAPVGSPSVQRGVLLSAGCPSTGTVALNIASKDTRSPSNLPRFGVVSMVCLLAIFGGVLFGYPSWAWFKGKPNGKPSFSWGGAVRMMNTGLSCGIRFVRVRGHKLNSGSPRTPLNQFMHGLGTL